MVLDINSNQLFGIIAVNLFLSIFVYSRCLKNLIEAIARHSLSFFKFVGIIIVSIVLPVYTLLKLAPQSLKMVMNESMIAFQTSYR